MTNDKHLLLAFMERERLATLEATALLDSPAEDEFDRFTRLASTILQTPVALISLIDQNRQFFKSAIGLPEPLASERETPLSHSVCQYVVVSAAPLSIADARTHPLLHENLAIHELGVVAYLGVPLTTQDGYTLGSLCAVDNKPRDWTARELAILQELADLVMAKIELRLLAKRLHDDYLQLRNLELHREEMVQMLIHDLRNPLASFLSGLELTQRAGELTTKQQKYVDLAQRGGKTLLQMINSALEVSKTEETQLDLMLEEVTPDQLIEAACTQLLPLAERAGVQLTLAAARQPSFLADIQKLQRVLVNLVSNGIQHTPSGGTVTISSEVDTAEDKAAVVRFAVRDTGKGIPPGAFERIFQKFDGPKSERVRDPSSGLGLPFSRMVIEAHRGQIWVESKLGYGTCFYFTIPVAVPVPERQTNQLVTTLAA